MTTRHLHRRQNRDTAVGSARTPTKAHNIYVVHDRNLGSPLRYGGLTCSSNAFACPSTLAVASISPLAASTMLSLRFALSTTTVELEDGAYDNRSRQEADDAGQTVVCGVSGQHHIVKTDIRLGGLPVLR